MATIAKDASASGVPDARFSSRIARLHQKIQAGMTREQSRSASRELARRSARRRAAARPATRPRLREGAGRDADRDRRGRADRRSVGDRRGIHRTSLPEFASAEDPRAGARRGTAHLDPPRAQDARLPGRPERGLRAVADEVASKAAKVAARRSRPSGRRNCDSSSRCKSSSTRSSDSPTGTPISPIAPPARQRRPARPSFGRSPRSVGAFPSGRPGRSARPCRPSGSSTTRSARPRRRSRSVGSTSISALTSKPTSPPAESTRPGAEIADCLWLKFNDRASLRRDDRLAELTTHQTQVGYRYRTMLATDLADALNHFGQNILLGGIRPDGADGTNGRLTCFSTASSASSSPARSSPSDCTALRPRRSFGAPPR